MEQRIFIKLAFEYGANVSQTYRKLVDHSGSDALSHSGVTYWRREFRGGRKDAEDSPRSGRPPDFGVRLRVERVFEAAPNGSSRSIAEITGHEPSTMFFILTQVLQFKFGYW
jgi:hypothetical protein